MEAEGDLFRPSPLDIQAANYFKLPRHTEVTSPGKGDIEHLRTKNEELEKLNGDYKRRLKGTQTLAVLLEESEDKVKHFQQIIEQLTASSKSSISNEPGYHLRQHLQRPSHLQVSPSYSTDDHTTEGSQKTSNERVFTQQSSNQDSAMSTTDGLPSDVITDSAPSDVDAEEQHNSNAAGGNASVHSQPDSNHSKSADISPLQSIHSEEFRSGAANRLSSTHERRTSTPTTPEAAGGRSPDHLSESLPSLAVRNLKTAISDLAGSGETSALTPLLATTVTQVMKLERDNNTKTILSRNLMLENAELKTSLNRIKEECDEIIDRQREEITALKNNIRRLYEEKEKDEYELVEKAQIEKATKVSTASRWESKEDEVMVTAGPSSVENVEKLKKKLSDLEKQNKEILQVNQQWDAHCKGMKAAMAAHISELQQKLEERERENARRRPADYSSSFDEQKQRDFDRMLIDASKRVEVEESAKESVMHDLHLEKQRSETLHNRVGVLERQVTQLLQLKTGMENEIKRLNKALAEAPPQPRTSQPDQRPIRTTEDMRSHIEALQAQVSVYQEDFANERRDRERIASEVDQLKTERETLKAERDTYAQQARWYEEDFRREHEEKERFQRMLSRRTMDDDYQFNVPARPIEKKAYPPRMPAEYFPQQRVQQYEPFDQYMGAYKVPQPPPYNEQQHRYNESQQGRLIRRGLGKEDLPNQYPKYGQNLARNDLEVDAGVEGVDGEAVVDPAIQNGRSLKCPRCEREFQEADSLRQHVDRCVS